MADPLSACPVCGENDWGEIYPGTLDHSLNPVVYFSSSRQVAGHWPVVRCQSCGMVVSNPRDSREELVEIYAQLSDLCYQSEERNRVAVADERVKLISRWEKPGRLLDLGCSTGIFCGRAAAAGWTVTGVDPSVWSVGQACNAYPAATFVNGTIEEVDFPPGTFDLVTLWDVLEHVHDPRLVLQKIQAWLAPGGWIVMNIPNSKSLVARMMGKSWVLLLREHLWYFSPDTIRRLLAQNGYELRAIRPNLVRFSLANIFARLAQYPGLGWCKSLAGYPLAQKISLRFPMGEMTVIARKVSA